MVYAFFEILGIAVAAWVGFGLDMPKPEKRVQLDVFIAAAVGLIVGAKLPVWLSYGFSSDLILSGKSVMGGILGAFIAINVYKYFSKQSNVAFGGRFVIPLAIAIGFGKIGCYFTGCCGGDFLLPPQILESVFQFVAAGFLYLFYRYSKRGDLLFPIYLLAYLVMRFFVEFVRNEPIIWEGMTIYQLMALLFVPVVMFILFRRWRKA